MIINCEHFLRELNQIEPATSFWGYLVYGTFKRSHSDEAIDSVAQEAVDNARLQAAVDRLLAHTIAYILEGADSGYGQQFVDKLRLNPAAYLPGASLADVSAHFRKHHPSDPEPERGDDDEYRMWQQEREVTGIQGSWCIVIDDKALQSLENVEPYDPVAEEQGIARNVAQKVRSEEAWVHMLSEHYGIVEPRQVDAVHFLWKGWFRCSPSSLIDVYDETRQGGDIENFHKGPDELLEMGL